MNKKLFSILFTLIFLSYTSTLIAAKNKVLSCSPSEVNQGDQNITLTLRTNSPMPQKSTNEYLYSEIQFSNPGVHVQQVSFKNPYIINCQISTDKYVDISKPVDITIISYDEKGEEVLFEGKKLLNFKRTPFLEKIMVHNAEGKIKQGEAVNITLKGYNFQSGSLGVLLVMSGLPIINTDCDNARQVRFSLTAEQTKSLQKGDYGIYIYNKDGSGCQSDGKVTVI